MQTRWPGGSIAMLYGPPMAPVIEPLHNSLDEARRIKAEIAAVAECDQLVRKKYAVLLDCLSNRHRVPWTLFWLCAYISVYDSDFSELKNLEMIFFLLMMLGFAASRFSDAG